MATVKLWSDTEAEAHPKVKAVFDDIRATRKSDFVNNFWRGLANQPEVLERTWNTLKAVMGAPGPLDPLTRELIYIAVSITNNCSYCIHSYGGGPREGDDRRAIFRFSGGGGHGLADKRAGDRPAAARRFGFPHRELNKESRSAGPSGAAAADETLDSEMRPIKARPGSLARASFLSDGGSLRCRPCRGLSARARNMGERTVRVGRAPSPIASFPDGLPTSRSSKERAARPPRGRPA